MALPPSRRIIMKRLLTAFLSLAFASCSMTSRYPVGGAIAGGAVGSLAGPGGAGVGSGIGYGAGKLGQLASDNKDLVKAISEQDVQALVEAGMGKQKGWMDEALETVYDFIKLCLIGVLLWNILPILYTRYVLKKVIKNNGKDKKPS